MLDNQFLAIINGLIVDSHIDTKCENFISVCYKLFYEEEAEDVTLVVDSNEYTIPNLKKNTGVEPIEGTVDPENNVSGYLGQFYLNSLNKTVFFKSTETYSSLGWVKLFQYIASPSEDQVLDNVTALLKNSQNIIETYYAMFYDNNPRDVEIELYNEQGVSQIFTLPNRAKSMKVGLSGQGTPEDAVEATRGTVYVNTATDDVFIKTTAEGSNGWYKLLNNEALEEHNSSPNAHLGYLARIDGDSSRVFKVATPLANSHAVNLKYTGALSNLKTIDKKTFVDAVNEINTKCKDLESKVDVIANAQPWSVINGTVDSNGDADLILSPEDVSNVYYEDVTAREYVDNTNVGSWSDNTSSLTDYYFWGNEGGVFGWPLGSGFHGWSKINEAPREAQEENRGQAGTPIVHTFTTPLGPGTYKFACGSNGYQYTLKATYDGSEHEIDVPLMNMGDPWAFTSTFTVTTSLTSISAEATEASGDWGIGAIHLIKEIANPATASNLTKVYFKVGPSYKDLTATGIDGRSFSKASLESIDLASVADGNYKVFLSRDGADTVYLKQCNIYRQKTVPTPSSNLDIWKDVSVTPLTLKEWDTTKSLWVPSDKDDIPVGEITVASHKITKAKTYPYCNRDVDSPTCSSPAYVVYTYQNGNSWLRQWSDGYIEQGGQLSVTTTNATINLIKSYSNTNYVITVGMTTGTETISSKAVGSFAIKGSASATCTWRAIGK